MKPKVSIVIPVWNQEKLVIRALNSIPESKNIEIIINNDCSTDNTYNAVSHWIAANKNKYYNVILLSNDKNMGVGYTINRCYDIATGEYVVALGSDDYFLTNFFMLAMEQLTGDDMVYFNLETNDGTVFVLNPESKIGYCGSTKFIKRSFMGDTRCPDKRAGEDWDFYQDLLKKNPTEKFTNLIVKHYNYPREGSLFDLMVKENKKSL